MCFGENPPFWHRLAQLRAGSGSEGPARRYPARTQPGPWLSPRGRTDGEAERCSALRTPLLASFNPGTGRHGRSRDAVVPRARQRAPGRAEPPGRNSRGGRDGANAPRGSGSSGAPRTAPLCQRPRDALLLQERCGGGPGVGAAGAWESRALLAAASCSVGAGPARGSSRHRVPRAGLCPRPLPGSGPAGMGPRSRRKAPGLGSALRSPSPRAGGRAWRVGSGRGGAGTGAESRRAERAARAAEPLLCPQVCSARGGFAGRGGSPARPGPARFGSARLAMVPRPALPVLAHSVLAALLLSAAQEPVPRVSLPYGECVRHGEGWAWDRPNPRARWSPPGGRGEGWEPRRRALPRASRGTAGPGARAALARWNGVWGAGCGLASLDRGTELAPPLRRGNAL